MVEKGVGERKRLTQLYEKRKEDLEKKHEEVRLSVEEERQKVIWWLLLCEKRISALFSSSS